MKSLLSISILSVLLSVCNRTSERPTSEDVEEIPVPAKVDESDAPEEDAIIEAEEPVIDSAVDKAESKSTPAKPKLQGEMPDTSTKKVIEHGAPDKARNDSVKNAKTKDKF